MLSADDLEEIASRATDELLRQLKEALKGSEDYTACVNIRRLEDGSVTAEALIETGSGGPATPEEEALIDKALQKALEVVRDELKRKCGGGGSPQELG